MREVLKMRFYCDFCKKSGGQRAAMIRHELGCTLNPNRVCKMCAKVEIIQQPLEKMIAAARLGLKELKDAASDDGHWPCPACMLAAIRQLRKAEPGRMEDDVDDYGRVCGQWFPGNVPDSLWEFNYKTEVREFWSMYSE